MAPNRAERILSPLQAGVLQYFPMAGWGCSQKRGALTSCGLGLLVFCVAPYLFDVATVEDADASTLHRPALVKREKSDLFGSVLLLSYDHEALHLTRLVPSDDNQGAVAPSAPVSPPHFDVLVSPASRPPPVY